MAHERMFEKGDRIDSFDELVDLVFDDGVHVWFAGSRSNESGRPVHARVVQNMTFATLWIKFKEGTLFRARRTEERSEDGKQ